MSADKLRFRFTKTGDLRFVSHLDLLRCGERMLRRAGVPYKSSAGFHPAPRLIFAFSLPLGVTGRNEVLELEFTEPVEPQDAFQRLNNSAPPGLTLTEYKPVAMKASAVARRVVYRFNLPEELIPATQSIAKSVMAEQSVWVSRYKPRPRQVNIRPYLRAIHMVEGALELDLWVTTTGTARADELLKLLGLTEAWHAGAVLERLTMEITDEVPDGEPDGPPIGPAETRHILELATNAANEIDTDHTDHTAARATWGLSPNGPVVE